MQYGRWSHCSESWDVGLSITIWGELWWVSGRCGLTNIFSRRAVVCLSWRSDDYTPMNTCPRNPE